MQGDSLPLKGVLAVTTLKDKGERIVLFTVNIVEPPLDQRALIVRQIHCICKLQLGH